MFIGASLGVVIATVGAPVVSTLDGAVEGDNDAVVGIAVPVGVAVIKSSVDGTAAD